MLTGFLRFFNVLQRSYPRLSLYRTLPYFYRWEIYSNLNEAFRFPPGFHTFELQYIWPTKISVIYKPLEKPGSMYDRHRNLNPYFFQIFYSYDFFNTCDRKFVPKLY